MIYDAQMMLLNMSLQMAVQKAKLLDLNDQ